MLKPEILDNSNSGSFSLEITFWLLISNATGQTVVAADEQPKGEPASREIYDRMIDTIRSAKSLSFSSQYHRRADGLFDRRCSYPILQSSEFFGWHPVRPDINRVRSLAVRQISHEPCAGIEVELFDKQHVWQLWISIVDVWIRFDAKASKLETAVSKLDPKLGEALEQESQ